MSDLEIIRLGLDELEAMRLCDLEGSDQATAGRRMGVSRGTVQRLLGTGREKLLRALLDGRALLIKEGDDHETVHPDRG
jgi:predicted DNA-binding protein (UPF0251 family)